MGTFERFQGALKNGTVTPEGGEKLSAQLKYDYMAAVHTMEEIMNLEKEFKARKTHRDNLLDKISGVLTLKQLDAAIKGLQECRNEIMKIDIVAREDEKLAKIIVDGISAGR